MNNYLFLTMHSNVTIKNVTIKNVSWLQFSKPTWRHLVNFLRVKKLAQTDDEFAKQLKVWAKAWEYRTNIYSKCIIWCSDNLYSPKKISVANKNIKKQHKPYKINNVNMWTLVTAVNAISQSSTSDYYFIKVTFELLIPCHTHVILCNCRFFCANIFIA